MGFDVPELIKRFTSAGTGPGQGGIPGHNLPLFVYEYQALTGAKPIPTTVRPPLVPTFIATYAGANHDMCKRTPLHDLQKNAGGVFRRMGVWSRVGETVEWIRFHTRYDGWDFHLVNLTDAMGVINISGPNARQVLAKVADTDLSNEAFPFSSMSEALKSGME